MPLGLEIQRTFTTISEKVYSVDLHPTETWILSGLESGEVCLWDYKSKSMVKSFKVSELPVHSAKFVARKQWIVVGADFLFVRVYNYNTGGKVRDFEAHDDQIKCLVVHPVLPFVLSSSDDMTIKLWDFDNEWRLSQTFKGHTDCVTHICFNPMDANSFASGSLDHTVKIWNSDSPETTFTLAGHDGGVNCVDYSTSDNKLYVISCSDDCTVKVWDHQTKSCIQTLNGTHNICAVCFYPDLPIFIFGSEDGTTQICNSITYRAEKIINYGFKGICAIVCKKESKRVVIGYAEGIIVIEICREFAVPSMDAGGNIIWGKDNEMQTVKVNLHENYKFIDGERLPLAVKVLGKCHLYPQILKHSSDGRLVAICGDGKYEIYTAASWNIRTSGCALELVWSAKGEYAIRQSASTVIIFNKSYQKKRSVEPKFSVERIFGGMCLSLCSENFTCFCDWTDGRIIHQFDVHVMSIYWADSCDHVAIANDASFYIMKYSRDGKKGTFQLLHKFIERVQTGLWAGGNFVYINSLWRFSCCLGGEVTTVYYPNHPTYLLGYNANQSQVYLIDRDFNVMSCTFPRNNCTNAILPSIPKGRHKIDLSEVRTRTRWKRQ